MACDPLHTHAPLTQPWALWCATPADVSGVSRPLKQQELQLLLSQACGPYESPLPPGDVNFEYPFCIQVRMLRGEAQAQGAGCRQRASGKLHGGHCAGPLVHERPFLACSKDWPRWCCLAELCHACMALHAGLHHPHARHALPGCVWGAGRGRMHRVWAALQLPLHARNG